MIKRNDILNILFRISLIIPIILILWRIFGNSQTDLSIMLAALFTVLIKMWGVSDELKDFKNEVRLSFHKARADINNINHKLDKIELKTNNLENEAKILPRRKRK